MDISDLVNSDSQFNILIGENGQGKTRLLDKIYFSSKVLNKNLIVINNPRGKNLLRRSSKFLTPNYKINDLNSLVDKLIKQCFFLIENQRYGEVDKKIAKISKLLNYLNLESELLFSVNSELLKKNFGSDFFDGDYDEYNLVKSLISYLDIRQDSEDNSYVCIDFNKQVFGDLENSIRFLYLIKYYWKEKIVTHVINRENNLILEFISLSSGEMNILLTIFFISISLSDTKENILIIDEPEISLHPKWQIEYIEKISDLFYLNNLKVYIATHSPLILTDLFFDKYEKIGVSYSIYHVKHSQIKLIEHEDEKSIEAIYWNIFGVLTPQSSFLSRKITDLLNLFTLGKLSLDHVIHELNVYQEASYDNKQRKSLEILKIQVIEKSQDLEKGKE